MKIIKLGWQHLIRTEKVMTVLSAAIGVGLAYLAVIDGYGLLSNQGTGPLIMAWLACYSLLLVGIMRMRSMALNHIFVQTLKELRDADKVSKEINEMIAGFLGDKA